MLGHLLLLSEPLYLLLVKETCKATHSPVLLFSLFSLLIPLPLLLPPFHLLSSSSLFLPLLLIPLPLLLPPFYLLSSSSPSPVTPSPSLSHLLLFSPPPFHLVSSYSPSTPSSSFSGGKVNSKDCHWLSPLHHAAARGHEATVKELIRQQADVMARDKNWMTPLHMAAHNNHLGCAGVCFVCAHVCFQLTTTVDNSL